MKGRSIGAAVLLGVAALLLVGAWQWWPAFRIPRAPAAPDMTAGLAPPAPAPPPTSEAPTDSARVVTPPVKHPARDSSPRMGDTGRPAKDTARPAPATAAPAPVSIDPVHQRYAQEWVKLRAEPTTSAAVLRVLQPGEVVRVDSLQDGWYRVAIDSLAVGYVDRQYLDTVPPRSP